MGATVYWSFLHRQWTADTDEQDQPVWLLRAFETSADAYLAGLDREQLLKEFIISPESGYGGIVLSEERVGAERTGAVPPLRVLRASALDGASGGAYTRPRPQSAYLTSALASGDVDAIALEASVHVSRLLEFGAPIVFDSPLTWSTDLDGDLLNLDDARLRRLIRWIDPRKKSRRPLARAANVEGTLAGSFARTMAAAGVFVARLDTGVALGSVQLLDQLPRELSDSVFQIARTLGSWTYAEALISDAPESLLDSLRAVSELTDRALRRKLRRMVVFRMATALMGSQHLADAGLVRGLQNNLTSLAEARGQVELSPKLSTDLPMETSVDSARFRALVRRSSVFAVNPGRERLPWPTARDTIVLISLASLDTATVAKVVGLYNPHRFVGARAVLSGESWVRGATRIMLLAGPTAPSDTVRSISARLADWEGRVISVAVGHPDGLVYLPADRPLYAMPVADDTDWRNLLSAPFGGVTASGRMIKTVIGVAEVGSTESLAQTRFGPLDPLTAGIDVVALTDIDAIVRSAIQADATPGAQVSVIYRGQLVYDQGFGVLAPGERDIVPDDLYDLASLTKVTATTLAAMKLYEEGLIKLDDPVRKYVKGMSPAAGALRVKDLLRHETGLRRDIPIQTEIHRNSRLFYGTDCVSKYCSRATERFSVPVAEKVYFSKTDQAHIYAAAKKSIPNQRKRYGDLNFFLLQQVIEHAAGVGLDKYVDSVFYRPMGLEMGYRPLTSHGQQIAPRIAPTEYDVHWRRQRLRGYVHDEAAALQGGVAGHAGNFGSAREVAILFDILARGGVYGERRYFEPETIATFVDSAPGETRALGFAKAPRPDKAKGGVLPVFGHTGFTGTSVWTDPERQLTIAFTSNRIYRGRGNWTLQKTKVREQVQRVVYQALPND